MRNLVVFRRKGDESVWLADLEAETLERLDPEALQTAGVAADFITVSDRARGTELSIVKGMDFAVAASMHSAAASHELYKRPVA
jgi:hypothetical protein